MIILFFIEIIIISYYNSVKLHKFPSLNIIDYRNSPETMVDLMEQSAADKKADLLVV